MLRLLRLAVDEFCAAGFFALAASGVSGFIGVACWSSDVSLVESDVTGSAAAVAVASVLPAFFGAWAFFLARRVAWSSAARAALVAAGAALVGVVAYRNVLLSHFFDGDDADLVSRWLWCALGLDRRDGAVDGVASLEAAVIAAAVVAAVIVQRIVQRMVTPPSPLPLATRA